MSDKKIFKIDPGSAEPSREPGVEQGKTGGLAVEKGEQRLELPLGSEAIAAQIFFGGDDSVGHLFVNGQVSDQPQHQTRVIKGREADPNIVQRSRHIGSSCAGWQ